MAWTTVFDGAIAWAHRVSGVRDLPRGADGRYLDDYRAGEEDRLFDALDAHPLWTRKDLAKWVSLEDVWDGAYSERHSYEAELFAWLRWGGPDKVRCLDCGAPASREGSYGATYRYRCAQGHRFGQAWKTPLQDSPLPFQAWLAVAVLLTHPTRLARGRAGAWVSAPALAEYLGISVYQGNKVLRQFARICDVRQRQEHPHTLLTSLLALPPGPGRKRHYRRDAPQAAPVPTRTTASAEEGRFQRLDLGA